VQASTASARSAGSGSVADKTRVQVRERTIVLLHNALSVFRWFDEVLCQDAPILKHFYPDLRRWSAPVFQSEVWKLHESQAVQTHLQVRAHPDSGRVGASGWQEEIQAVHQKLDDLIHRADQGRGGSFTSSRVTVGGVSSVYPGAASAVARPSPAQPPAGSPFTPLPGLLSPHITHAFRKRITHALHTHLHTHLCTLARQGQDARGRSVSLLQLPHLLMISRAPTQCVRKLQVELLMSRWVYPRSKASVCPATAALHFVSLYISGAARSHPLNGIANTKI
jgi:hypothetical protein